MKLPTLKRKQSGFTLLELLIVVAIIAILISIGLASFSRVQKSARDTQRRSDLENIRGALEQYYADYNNYPTGVMSDLSDALEGSNPRSIVYLNEVQTLGPLGTADPYIYDDSGGSGQTYCLGSATMETVTNDSETCGSNDYGFVLTPQD
ncbi:MAG: Type II secretion system protein G [Candidatus Woesebacteria bacterium GW2011_GWA1_45_8]|nr:MAG: Type II secretion system protein G [Candidatus Woesebacteria bacterium GW2011_GWA1_45_8]